MNKTQKGYWIFFMDCVRAGHQCMWQCLLMGHCIQLSATLFKFIFFFLFLCVGLRDETSGLNEIVCRFI